MKSDTTITDKELIRGALTCIELLLDHFKGQSKADLRKNLLLHDAIRYRLSILGKIISEVSLELKSKHRSFNWFISCLAADEEIAVAWSLFKPVRAKIGSKNGLILLYEQLEDIYNQEFAPDLIKFRSNEETRDFFNLKTTKSIRTVRKR